MTQLLAVAAELLLLVCCLFAAWKGGSTRPAGMLLVAGALSLGLAATLGALEYAGNDALAQAHQLASRLAGGLGLPAMMIAPALGVLETRRQGAVAVIAVALMLCGLWFGVGQIGQVLLVVGLVSAGVPAWQHRGTVLRLWLVLTAVFAITLLARSQASGPLSAGMTTFHTGLALLTLLLGNLLSMLTAAGRSSNKSI